MYTCEIESNPIETKTIDVEEICGYISVYGRENSSLDYVPF
jgi:hypothetical protein